jgi:GNAT superfamily N-acetyltransferase
MARSWGVEPSVRPMESADLPRVSTIFKSAFNEMYRRRGFGPVVGDLSTGAVIADTYRAHDPEHCLVVLRGSRVVGSGFLHVRGVTAGAGPITIDPVEQGSGCGRVLMEEICRRADASGVRSLRLIQDSFNEVSFSLYGRVGFAARETLVRGNFSRPPSLAGTTGVRAGSRSDLEAVVQLEKELLGIERAKDYDFLTRLGEFFVAGSGSTLRGSCVRLVRSGVAVLGPVVGRDLETTLALLQRATEDLPRGTEARLLLPASRDDLLAACWSSGFEVHSLCTYMVRGEFEPFGGYYLPTLLPESG